MYCFFPFGFIHVTIFVINTWDPYSSFFEAKSCVKVLDHLNSIGTKVSSGGT